MLRTALPTALAAVLCITSPCISIAKAPPVTTSPAQTAPSKPAALVSGSSTIGTVFGENITWDEFTTYLQNDEPGTFQTVLSQAVAPGIVGQLFGPSAKPSITLTPADALQMLRENPPATLVSELNNYLTRKMIEHEAAAEKVVVTKQDVDDFIARQLANARASGAIPAGTTDEQFLAERGFSKEALEKLDKPSAMLVKLINIYLAKQDGHPIGPNDFLQASHILIKAPVITASSTAAEKKADADALAKIKAIRKDIVSGKITFAEAAKKYGEDNTKTTGGDLGVFMYGSMVPSFDKAAFGLKPGVVSEPVHTRFGYHLIEVTKQGDQISKAARDKALLFMESNVLPRYLQSIQKKADIVNLLQKEIPPSPMIGAGGDQN